MDDEKGYFLLKIYSDIDKEHIVTIPYTYNEATYKFITQNVQMFNRIYTSRLSVGYYFEDVDLDIKKDLYQKYREIIFPVKNKIDLLILDYYNPIEKDFVHLFNSSSFFSECEEVAYRDEWNAKIDGKYFVGYTFYFDSIQELNNQKLKKDDEWVL